MENLDADAPNAVPVPEATAWERRCLCCGRTVESNSANRCFVGYTAIWPVIPAVVFSASVSYFVLFCTFQLSRIRGVWLVIAALEVSLTFVLFMICYFRAAFADSGYLPYSWFVSRRSKYSWEELMNGTCVRADQISFVDVVPRPPGCSYSRAWGRYVLRADHVCIWISNWVGLRNHKFFLLLLLWGGGFCASCALWRWAAAVPAAKGWRRNMDWALTGIGGIVALQLWGSASGFICELGMGTRVARYKGMGENVGCCHGAREICGSSRGVCWFCPTTPFADDIPLVFEGFDQPMS